MSKKYNQENFTIDDEILETASDMLHTEIEMDIMEHEKREVCIPKDLDDKILNMMKDKDKAIKAKKKHVAIKKITKIAAIFLVVFVTTGVIAIDKSDALKEDFLNFIYGNGIVKVENDVEGKVMNSWKEFWYPSFVPDDLILKGAEEENHMLLYFSEASDREMRISEMSLDTTFTLDRETTKIYQMKVAGNESFYYKDNDKNISGIIIKYHNKYVLVECTGTWKQSEVIKVADGLVYIKNKNLKNSH